MEPAIDPALNPEDVVLAFMVVDGCAEEALVDVMAGEARVDIIAGEALVALGREILTEDDAAL